MTKRPTRPAATWLSVRPRAAENLGAGGGALGSGDSAVGHAVQQAFLYALNDIFSVGVRGELWRDADGFYIASFAENDDALDALRGGNVTLDPKTVGGGTTTYGAVTVGVPVSDQQQVPAAVLKADPARSLQAGDFPPRTRRRTPQG